MTTVAAANISINHTTGISTAGQAGPHVDPDECAQVGGLDDPERGDGKRYEHAIVSQMPAAGFTGVIILPRYTSRYFSIESSIRARYTDAILNLLTDFAASFLVLWSLATGAIGWNSRQ